jgi:hypothetical protein
MAPSDVVVEPVVITELWEQLLVRERELDKRENALVARENIVMEVERPSRTIGPGCMPLPPVSGVP